MAREPSQRVLNLEIDPPSAPARELASAESAQSFETKGVELPVQPSNFDTAYFDDKNGAVADTEKVRKEPLAASFGRYRLQSVLGRGGMGEVYLAFDTMLRRHVALKAPKLVQDSPVQRDRFLREARSAAALHHPNICPLYDVGEHDGQLYLTMAYVDGPTLSALLREHGTLDPDQAVAMVHKIATGMQHAHERGLLHRDLKPGNILLTKTGEPVVTDFGLAFEFESQSKERLTETGLVVGTPTYMPPEQVNGQALSPASDVYSLGVVFYELLTGKAPFSGTLGKLIAQIETADPEPPSQIIGRIDPELNAICLKALAKNSADRFAAMTDFAQALESYSESKKARALGEQATAALQRRLRRRVTILAAASVVAVAAAVTAAVLFARREDRDVAPVPPMQMTDADRLFQALVKPLVKIDCKVTPESPRKLGRQFLPAGLFQIPTADGNNRFHDGPLYFSISGEGAGHVLDLTDQPGQAGQVTHFSGEITVNAPYLLFLGNLTKTSQIHIKGGLGYSILAPMNGGQGCQHVEFDGTHFLPPKIGTPKIDMTSATGAERAGLRNADLITKVVWAYERTEYVIYCRPGTQVVPGPHELRREQFPEVYDIIEADRKRQWDAPTIRSDRVEKALREAGIH